MDSCDVGLQGTRVRVHRWGGEGIPILYWHGGGGGSEERPALAPFLAAAGYSVLAPDAPGYGDSAPLEPSGYSPAALAGLAAELIDALGLAPVIWSGSSWGGNIGLHTAARFPDAVRAVVLLDGGYLEAADDPEFDPSAGLEEVAEELRRRMEDGESWDASPEVIAAAIVASQREPCTPLYPQIAASGVPILLVHATEPPELHPLRRAPLERFRSGLPHARIVPIPGAGHAMLADNGPEVRRSVLDWLAELG